MANMKVLAITVLALGVIVSSISADPVSYNCKGSSLCKFIPQGDCDAAERQIIPGNLYSTGGNKGSTGTCKGHCGLFVSGSTCSLSGSDMITAFNELRNMNCQICGSKTFPNGCEFVMNYVNGC